MKSGQSVHYRTCCLCEAMCGLEITHKDEQIISIKGDKKDPLSQGYICPKAVALQDLHNDPNRLKQPVKRVGNEWETISWNEAFDLVATKLAGIQQAFGNNAIGAYSGNPNVHSYTNMLFMSDFIKSLNTVNFFTATSVDQLPHHLVSHLMYGHQLMIAIPDLDQTDHLIVLGGNPITSNGSMMSSPNIRQRLQAIRERGKVVVIDPRRNETADHASEHHFIRPGADALLLLAMLHTVTHEGLTRQNHCSSLFDNEDQLKGLVTNYSPERVADRVGISAEQIKTITREYAAAPTAVLYGRMGASVQAFGALNHWLIAVLNAITGRLDSPGGAMFTTPAVDMLAKVSRGHFKRSKTRVRGLPSFSGEMPVSALAEEILTPGEGQIRGLVTCAGNPVLTTPNSKQLDEALEHLDFMVSIDLYINETTRHADVILPPVGHLERDHYDLIFNSFAVRNVARYSEALFKPADSARYDWEILLNLRKRIDRASGRQNLKSLMTTCLQGLIKPQGMLDILLRTGPHGKGFKPFKEGLSLKALKKAPHGLDLGVLKPQLPGRLFTKNKRIDLVPEVYRQDLERVESHFFNESYGDTNAHYPFRLIGRRHLRSNNSWMHNSQRLVKGRSRCYAMIHPLDASALNIAEGDYITVESRVGALAIPASITEDIMPGVICIPHGWGHTHSGAQLDIAKQNAGVSVNDVTDEQSIDALSGNAVLNGVPVNVQKFEASAEPVLSALA